MRSIVEKEHNPSSSTCSAPSGVAAADNWRVVVSLRDTGLRLRNWLAIHDAQGSDLGVGQLSDEEAEMLAKANQT
jgi:hypothetical protein